MANAVTTIVELKCDKCGNTYNITLDRKNRRECAGTPNYCQKCMKEYMREKQTNYFSSLSPEEQQKFIDKRNWYATASDEKKSEFSQKMSEINNSRSDEEKAVINQKNAEGVKRHWDTLSQQQRLDRVKGMREGNRLYWDSMTPEERSKKAAEWYYNLSECERNYVHDMLSERMTKYNASLTYEEKLERAKCMQEWHKNLTREQKHDLYERTHQWYHDLSDDEKLNYANKKSEWYYNLSDTEKRAISEYQTNYWKNLPEEEKARITKKKLNAVKSNNLHKRFEHAFSSSNLIGMCYFLSETLTENETIHSWDYGIYDLATDELIMVVDLDGAYYHADICDYDGIHSKEEYDEKRWLSIPNNLKWIIINELSFNSGFQLLLKTIIMNYDEYIDNLFKIYRSMPFPEYKYDNIELIKSIDKLYKMKCDDKYHSNISLNTRIGDRVIHHFHHSIYHAHVRGNIAPYDAWYNDKLLRKCIENRVLYQPYLNKYKILQGFNVSKIAPKVSVFSAGRAKLLIYRYLNNYDEIFDPFSGFSGRMLGALSLRKRYIGNDVSEIHVMESNEMIKFMRKVGFNIDANVTVADILSEQRGSYQCLFTCPPYGDKEIWSGVKPDTRSCDDWIDICLSKFKCNRYLFVVDYTKKYVNNIVDIIQNRSHFSNNNEFVIVINR